MPLFQTKCARFARYGGWPKLWLFTDERVADAMLLSAIARLPRGSGVVFRHYRLDQAARRALYERVQAIARRGGLMLLIGGGDPVIGAGKADGTHVSPRQRAARRRGGGLLTASAHDLREIGLANRRGADLVFLSPVFPTRSHPGARALGPLRFASLARLSQAPVIALGGMTERRFKHVKALGACGWAGIDALAEQGRRANHA